MYGCVHAVFYGIRCIIEYIRHNVFCPKRRIHWQQDTRVVDLSPYKPTADDGCAVDPAKAADLEMGVEQWRARGLPPAQSREQRWGASYPLQFRILFMRCAPPARTPFEGLSAAPVDLVLDP